MWPPSALAGVGVDQTKLGPVVSAAAAVVAACWEATEKKGKFIS